MSRRMSRVRAGVASVGLVLLSACAGTTTVTGTDVPEIDESIDPAELIQQVQERLQANPDDADAWFQLGLAWQRRADASSASAPAFRDSARVAYEALLERDPENVKGLVHHGLVLEDLQQPDDALSAYKKAIALAPDDPHAYVNLGALEYFQFKRTFEAKEALTKALELEPNSPDAHFNLGVLFADANLFGEARAEWERVVELDPDGAAGQLARENLERIAPLLEEQDAAP